MIEARLPKTAANCQIVFDVLLAVIFFLTFPMIAKHFENQHVSDYDNFSDMAVNYFLKYPLDLRRFI